MRLKHFYIPADLSPSRSVATPPELRHRLQKVLRLGQGHPLQVFNGQDGLFNAHIEDDRCTRLRVESQTQPFTPRPALRLALVMPKREAWETALRQSTELGTTEIFPLLGDHSVPTRLNEARAQDILIEAAEQSERLDVPTLHPLQPLPDFLSTLSFPLLWAYERQEEPTPPLAATGNAILIGPEGGFSEREIALLTAHPQVRTTTLGTTILRTDTAVVAALSRLQGQQP